MGKFPTIFFKQWALQVQKWAPDGHKTTKNLIGLQKTQWAVPISINSLFRAAHDPGFPNPKFIVKFT